MFNDLQEYYDYIEANTHIQKDDTISASLTRMRDKITDDDLKKLCSYELFINDFHIRKNELKARFTQQTKNGRQEYPNLQLFEDNLDYLKSRAENITHSKLKAKYNHILWLSKAKHINFAKAAVDNYYDYVTTCTFPNNDVILSMNYIELIENLFLLSQEISYKSKEVLAYLVSILGTGRIHGYQEYAIMNFIAVEGKKIPDTLKAFFDYTHKVISGNLYPNALKDYIKVQLVIAQKSNLPLAPFYNKLAEFYVDDSKKHDGTFVVMGYYMKALQQYKKAGNKDKIEEISILMDKAKNNLNLNSVPFEFSDPAIDDFFKNAEKQIDGVIDNFGPDQLFQYLIICPDMFPKADQLNNSITNSLMQVVSVTTFDQNKNISGRTGGGFNIYDIYLKTISMQHLSMFFHKAHLSGKFSFSTITEFILKSTWYGDDAEHIKSNGTITHFQWAQLIFPALENFFSQTEIDFSLNKFNRQAYILCIDSLALKFEGLLREFSRRIGAQAIEIKDNSTQERITIDRLLDNQKFIDLVPPDDIALFKYLFTNQGENLRNNVAHCFFLPMNYSPEWMWLLITATLKLGAYKLNK
jgi:hypothetical protein